jgi:hypothetical protein
MYAAVFDGLFMTSISRHHMSRQAGTTLLPEERVSRQPPAGRVSQLPTRQSDPAKLANCDSRRSASAHGLATPEQAARYKHASLYLFRHRTHLLISTMSFCKDCVSGESIDPMCLLVYLTMACRRPARGHADREDRDDWRLHLLRRDAGGGLPEGQGPAPPARPLRHGAREQPGPCLPICALMRPRLTGTAAPRGRLRRERVQDDHPGLPRRRRRPCRRDGPRRTHVSVPMRRAPLTPRAENVRCDGVVQEREPRASGHAPDPRRGDLGSQG